MLHDVSGNPWSAGRSKKTADRGRAIERLVILGRVSRSGFYHFEDAEADPDRDMELRDTM